jgi:hypothetical protein
MSEHVDPSFIAQLRPAFRIGFQPRRRRPSLAVTSERERPVLTPMSIKIVEMPKEELEKLPGLTNYR